MLLPLGWCSLHYTSGKYEFCKWTWCILRTRDIKVNIVLFYIYIANVPLICKHISLSFHLIMWFIDMHIYTHIYMFMYLQYTLPSLCGFVLSLSIFHLTQISSTDTQWAQITLNMSMPKCSKVYFPYTWVMVQTTNLSFKGVFQIAKTTWPSWDLGMGICYPISYQN